MKRVTFFKSAILALLACVCFVACENNLGEIPTEPETYTVKLGWAGEILDVSYEPLSTRATTDNLYGIQVYSNDDSGWMPYAYGLFDDPNNITVTLQNDCKYKFVATMVKDGKNRLHKNDYGEYYSPFGGVKIGDDFTYSSTTPMSGIIYGNANIVFADGGYNSYLIPNIERFYGELSDYIPVENTNVNIDMKRTVFGAKFVVGGKLAIEGKLDIQIEGAPKMELALTEGYDEISEIFTFNEVSSAWAKDDYTEDINVTFIWVRVDGTESPMGTHEITFKRNTMTVVEVNIENEGDNAGIGLNIPDSETGDLDDGDTVVIVDGELVETEVGTEE